MPFAHPPSLARPTFSEAIDGLVAGFGVAMNRDDALSNMDSFASRVDVYSESFGRPGREEKLLNALASTDADLKSKLLERLRQAETDLAMARSIPLLTEDATEMSLRRFIEHWALYVLRQPSQSISDSRGRPRPTMTRPDDFACTEDQAEIIMVTLLRHQLRY
jgi:hypothetical protein